jgi:hypothetical protein
MDYLSEQALAELLVAAAKIDGQAGDLGELRNEAAQMLDHVRKATAQCGPAGKVTCTTWTTLVCGSGKGFALLNQEHTGSGPGPLIACGGSICRTRGACTFCIHYECKVDQEVAPA